MEPLCCPRCGSSDCVFKDSTANDPRYKTIQYRYYCRDCRRSWVLGGKLRSKRPRTPEKPVEEADSVAVSTKPPFPRREDGGLHVELCCPSCDVEPPSVLGSGTVSVECRLLESGNIWPTEASGECKNLKRSAAECPFAHVPAAFVEEVWRRCPDMDPYYCEAVARDVVLFSSKLMERLLGNAKELGKERSRKDDRVWRSGRIDPARCEGMVAEFLQDADTEKLFGFPPPEEEEEED